MVNEFNGTFTDWRMTLWGESIDPAIQELLPMPTESDDDDHDVISASPTYVSITPGQLQPTSLPANPTDHQDRPINAKPTTPAGAPISISASASTSASATALPDAPEEEDDSSKEHFLPHYFPTFGVSKRTQIWIYVALGIIVLFCLALGTYFMIQRRKRTRSEREDYEFEELLDADMNGITAEKRTKRRAGELYDAFAGGSEEEDGGLLSAGDSDEEGRYQDEAPGAVDEKRGRSQSREDGEDGSLG